MSDVAEPNPGPHRDDGAPGAAGARDAPDAPDAGEAAPDAPRARVAPAAPGGRRSLLAALVLGALGVATALLASRETWARGSAPSAGSLLPVSATGGEVTGVPEALALVALAALVAVFTVRGAGRLAVGVLLTACGAGTVWASLAGAAGTAALDAAASSASGLTATAVRHATHTGWPWVAALGGLLLAACGLLVLLRGRSWPAMSARYERAGSAGTPARRAPRDPEHPAEIWKALDRGEDPTV